MYSHVGLLCKSYAYVCKYCFENTRYHLYLLKIMLLRHHWEQLELRSVRSVCPSFEDDLLYKPSLLAQFPFVCFKVLHLQRTPPPPPTALVHLSMALHLHQSRVLLTKPVRCECAECKQLHQ